MKTLNERAAEILRAMLASPTDKPENSGPNHRPIHIKSTAYVGKYSLISLTQYTEIKGIRYRDPELRIAFDPFERQFIPYYYVNDFFEVESYYATPTEAGLMSCDEIDQHNFACFVNRWLLQTASKQGI